MRAARGRASAPLFFIARREVRHGPFRSSEESEDARSAVAVRGPCAAGRREATGGGAGGMPFKRRTRRCSFSPPRAAGGLVSRVRDALRVGEPVLAGMPPTYRAAVVVGEVEAALADVSPAWAGLMLTPYTVRPAVECTLRARPGMRFVQQVVRALGSDKGAGVRAPVCEFYFRLSASADPTLLGALEDDAAAGRLVDYRFEVALQHPLRVDWEVVHTAVSNQLGTRANARLTQPRSRRRDRRDPARGAGAASRRDDARTNAQPFGAFALERLFWRGVDIAAAGPVLPRDVARHVPLWCVSDPALSTSNGSGWDDARQRYGMHRPSRRKRAREAATLGPRVALRASATQARERPLRTSPPRFLYDAAGRTGRHEPARSTSTSRFRAVWQSRTEARPCSGRGGGRVGRLRPAAGARTRLRGAAPVLARVRPRRRGRCSFPCR